MKLFNFGIWHKNTENNKPNIDEPVLCIIADCDCLYYQVLSYREDHGWDNDDYLSVDDSKVIKWMKLSMKTEKEKAN